MRKLLAIFAVAALSGCGSHRLDYTAHPLPAAEAPRAAEIVEQGFYEDRGKRAPASVLVTDRYILLSDGVISKTSGLGSAAPIGSGAIAAGNSTTVTREAGQRIYFNNLGPATIHQKNMRDNRFILVIRARDGATLRTINTYSLEQAERIADALETLRTSAER